MEKGLFEKYSKVLHHQSSQKKEIIDFIKITCGAIFSEEEIVIQKKKISFQTSSVKKTILQNKNITEFLIKKGYILTR